jgi:hypothetical protein
MQSFIVLGIIPGTNIQTNLNFWVIIYIVLTVVMLRARFTAIRQYVQRQLTIHLIARTINSFELISRV